MNQTTKKTNPDFIMSPKVDVCFAGLMENPIVRKGFCAAILRVPPETVERTELLPTHLQRNHAGDKLGILDFILFPKDKRCYRRISFCDRKTGKLYSDKLEIQILELKKLPKKIKTGEDIVNWMRFFNGKNKEDFKQMSKKSAYLGEAYEALQKLSADDLKRLEYEAREKALKDHNSFLSSAQRSGEKIGEKRGRKIGEKHIAPDIYKLGKY